MLDYNLPSHYITNKQKYFGKVADNQWIDWKWQIRNGISDYSWLKEHNIDLGDNNLPFFISPYFFCLIDTKNKNNPLAMQVLPSNLELASDKFILLDPFLEETNSPISGVIKRFKDRVVVLVSNKCASLCRFCTRKWNWNKNIYANHDFNQLKKYLSNNPQIREVIISGGEPFLLSSKVLDNLLSAVFSVSSIESVRIGTRILTFLPHRITDKVCSVLSKYKPLWIMSHFNHPDEINYTTIASIDKLLKTGVVINNQSVLLKGVNDNILTLNHLYRKLVNLRIKPYYIFQCDPVKGTEQFSVKKENGSELMRTLTEDLGGLCIPQYVEDTTNRGKVRIPID